MHLQLPFREYTAIKNPRASLELKGVGNLTQNVIIKSNKFGLIVYMNPDAEYSQILDEMRVKFTESAKFFKGATMAITFEGKILTKLQEQEIIELITDVAHVQIVCIFDKEENTERLYQSVVEESLEDLPRKEGQFYRGTLKKRQVLESEKSIIVLGDVEFGATVVSKGNIVVLGTIRGTVHAGAAGNRKAFIVALSMKPQSMRIADVTARHVYLRKEEKADAKIARLEGERIYIDPLKNQEW